MKGAVAAGGTIVSAGTLPLGRSSYAQEHTFDVVVVGSGAAGMTAALTAAKKGLSVVLIEKAKRFGGSTARSGGGIWIRNNSITQEVGINDSPEMAAEYLAAVVGKDVPIEKQQAFLEHGPDMIDFILKNTPLTFRWMEGYAEYYPDLPGAIPEGASIEPEVFDGKLLGEELSNLNPPYIPTPEGAVIFGGDYKWLTLAAVTLKGAKTALDSISRYIKSKLKGQIPLTMGQALAAGLRKGLMDANVTVWLDTPLDELTTDDDGRVVGVVARKNGSRVMVNAQQGVIVAAGGFEHNLAMREQFQKKPISTDWTLGARSNTGDGILAGASIGADLELMDDAWWGPTIQLLPNEPYFCLSERSLPGTILVNRDGQRFVNESAPYHDVVKAMYQQTNTSNELDIWLITDQSYRDKYLFKDLFPLLPFPSEWFESGALVKGESISELAEKTSLPESELWLTIQQFNSYAENGRDEDYGRGDNAFDRYYSDPNVKPNPSLGEIKRTPFYAFRMFPGDLGTKGGLRTNGRSQVLRPNNTIIEGLYAAGNSSNSVMGYSYAGAGSTIGPAMTFGYIAATHIAENLNRNNSK